MNHPLVDWAAGFAVYAKSNGLRKQGENLETAIKLGDAVAAYDGTLPPDKTLGRSLGLQGNLFDSTPFDINVKVKVGDGAPVDAVVTVMVPNFTAIILSAAYGSLEVL